MNSIVETQQRAVSAAAESDIQRSIAEVQATIILAKKFPRDVMQASQRILDECGRPALAEVATYEYAKGGNAITGPSIRLAEVLAMYWCNINSGWRDLGREVVRGEYYAEIEAFAWDVENNRRQTVLFKTKLVRNTKKGSYPLKDERDIYEHCANQAKRRERACILSLIPGYIIDQALDQCKRTLAETVKPDTTRKMIAAFQEKFGVTEQQIAQFIQRDIDAIQPGQVVRLRQIYNSLKDGMAQPDEFFQTAEEGKPEEKKTGNDGLKEKLEKKLTADQSSPSPSEPSQEPELISQDLPPSEQEDEKPVVPSFINTTSDGGEIE